MNTYTEKPKRGNAKKAWDWFVQENDGRIPKEMFYNGRVWVAYYGSIVSYGKNVPVFHEISTQTLLFLLED